MQYLRAMKKYIYLVLAIIGIALWILFHVLATKEENREWDEADRAFDAERLLPGVDEPAHLAAAHLMPPDQRQAEG